MPPRCLFKASKSAVELAGHYYFEDDEHAGRRMVMRSAAAVILYRIIDFPQRHAYPLAISTRVHTKGGWLGKQPSFFYRRDYRARLRAGRARGRRFRHAQCSSHKTFAGWFRQHMAPISGHAAYQRRRILYWHADAAAFSSSRPLGPIFLIRHRRAFRLRRLGWPPIATTHRSTTPRPASTKMP